MQGTGFVIRKFVQLSDSVSDFVRAPMGLGFGGYIEDHDCAEGLAEWTLKILCRNALLAWFGI